MVVAAILLFLSAGCTQYKNIVYMQDRYETDSSSQAIDVSITEDIVLRPDDNIYINVYGVDMGQIDLFNKLSGGQNSNYTEMLLYLNGYIIDKNGEVELPVIGNLKLAGLPLSEARTVVQKAIDEYLKGVVVDVRLLSYRVTLLGEVNQPGVHTFYQREINLLDAIGQASDISSFGDKKHILIIRKEGDKTKTVELDLTRSDFYQNPYFWIKPNDVIYVKPLRSKMVNLNSTTLTLALTTLTTLIVILTYFK